MALFAISNDIQIRQSDENSKLASVNFVASSKVSETLAQSGHLALSAPSQIMGQFQSLKAVSQKKKKKKNKCSTQILRCPN
ncbi:hypothetical protein BY458DRAFT_248983 [Sporodiniella umbellata]|nr:hypothetical protein BY458DRAFT_248983 [Sporodiniella umbellata]